MALLSLMYDTGARVQEMIDLTPSVISLDKPNSIQITGKGSETRIVPLLEKQVFILRNYLSEFDLLTPQARSYPLFFSGVNLVYIRDILGHTSVQTTEIKVLDWMVKETFSQWIRFCLYTR